MTHSQTKQDRRHTGKTGRHTLRVNREHCKGCEICVAACPHAVLGMSEGLNLRGYHTAVVVDAAQCTGCLQCARICPDAAIEILREVDE